MARDFVRANSEYFIRTEAIVTGVPLTIAAWFRGVDVTNSQDIVGLGHATVSDAFRLNLGGNAAGDPVRAVSNDGGTSVIAATTSGYSANTWHHAAAVFETITSRAAYIDGGSKGTNATSNAPAPDRTIIGAGIESGVVFGFCDARLAEVGIWNVALTDNEIAMLAAGVSPLRVRPGNLKGYWPLPAYTGDATDYSGQGKTLTDTNTVGVADHAPVGPMFGFGGGWPGAFTAAGGTVDKTGTDTLTLQEAMELERTFPPELTLNEETPEIGLSPDDTLTAAEQTPEIGLAPTETATLDDGEWQLDRTFPSDLTLDDAVTSIGVGTDESLALAESASVDTGAEVKTGTDALTLAEQASITVTVASSDAPTVSEFTAAVEALLDSLSDTMAATESSTLTQTGGAAGAPGIFTQVAIGGSATKAPTGGSITYAPVS